MSKENKSILEEAATDLQEIVEAAKKVAKDNLAKELPQKFDMLLNEELKKVSSKESVKESVEDKDKEPVVEGKKTDKKKESINETLDMSECSLAEVENAYEQAGDAEEFSITPDGETQTPNEVTVDTIAAAIDSMGKLNNEKEMADKEESDPITKFEELAQQMGQMVKEMKENKMYEQYVTEFNSHMTETYGEGFETSLGEETCGKLKEAFIAKKKSVNESETKPFVEKGKTLTEDEDQPFDETPSSNTPNVAEQKNNGGEQTKGRENGGPTNEMIEEGEDKKDDDVKVELEGEVTVDNDNEKEDEREEKPVDEIHGQSYSSGKVRAGSLPNQGAEYRDRPGHSRNRPQWSNETYQKRMKSLIEENKKLTKEVNLAKKSFDKAEKLVESYKGHLEKYRTQLREMAVFNTNLANVNNLLVNEELALTSKDKVSIINKFKTINSVNESDNVYGQVIDFMKKKEGVQTITEDVEKKVTTSVGESSKKKLDEAVERTAYSDNEHIKKIKGLMSYVDTRK